MHSTSKLSQLLNKMKFLIILIVSLLHLSSAVKDCYQEGLFCESCTSLVHCTHNSDDSWSKTSKQSCPWGQKCLQAVCTNDPEPICDGIADMDFVCTSIGLFPHPFYCNKFVMCVDDWGLRPFVSQCDDGYGFNLDTYECDIELEGHQCKELDYPVPPCQSLLQSGTLDNPTFYYRCQEVKRNLFDKVLFPVLYRCDHGLIYDIQSDRCQ